MSKLKIKLDFNCIACFLIVFAEMCLYTGENIHVYRIFTYLGIFIIFSLSLIKLKKNLKLNRLILWLILIYSLFIFYAIFFMRNNSTPVPMLITRLFECLSLAIAFKQILNNNENFNKLINLFIIIALLCSIYFLIQEVPNIISGASRVGNELSNNVNTVGYCFGILSIFVLWSYHENKNIFKLLLFILLCVIMLLTGSKKVLIILMMNLFMYLKMDKGSKTKWIKFSIVVLVFLYIIFFIPYFYQIIGRRVESMFLTLTNNTTKYYYSESTEDRFFMIKEGLSLAKRNPIFGGGWGYYAANTLLKYNYSHNNYIELLCSFGIFGLLLFYCKYFINLYRCAKILRVNSNMKEYNIFVLAFTLIVSALILDIGTVSFSAQCVFYIPIILSSIIIENNRRVDDEK